MQYYILMPGDKESELSDANNLGESSFDIFWAGRGLVALINIINKNPELIEEVEIITDTGNRLSIGDFLSKIQGLKVRY